LAGKKERTGRGTDFARAWLLARGRGVTTSQDGERVWGGGKDMSLKGPCYAKKVQKKQATPKEGGDVSICREGGFVITEIQEKNILD